MPLNPEAYEKTLDFLYQFTDYSLSRNFAYNPETFNLKRMERIMELLGNPHLAAPVIHVAGTKGKGSTAAMIAAALQANGYRVGFYTSPHLVEFTERVQINAVPIKPEELVRVVEEMKPILADLGENATFFEWITALAFLFFKQQACQINVIEVGLGGRLDSTNVVNPLVSVITSLSYDHMAILGDTLAKIAREKAGIIKPGRPVVSAPQEEEALSVIRGVAKERGSRLIEVGEQFGWKVQQHSLSGQTVRIFERKTESGKPRTLTLHLPLLGEHQALNAATALAALWSAQREGLALNEHKIRAGIRKVSWPGRFEILQQDPYLVIDSAHNPASAQRLAETLSDYFPGKPLFLLFGASADKDIKGMLQILAPGVKKVITTQSIHPRAAEAQALAEVVRGFGTQAEAVVPAETALRRGLELASAEDGVLIAAGSLFVAGAVRAIWNQMQSEKVLIPAKGA